jgi:hypothetical protein
MSPSRGSWLPTSQGRVTFGVYRSPVIFAGSVLMAPHFVLLHERKQPVWQLNLTRRQKMPLLSYET